MTPDTITVDGTTYTRAYPVAGNRCAGCGQEEPVWTPAACIQAAQAWATWAGHTPRGRDWMTARAAGEPHRPVAETVYRIFGSWLPMLRAAGLAPMPTGAPKIWTRERIVDALLEWRVEYGDWPKTTDWQESTPTRPHYQLIYGVFGSWREALDAAKGTGAVGGRGLVDSAPVIGALQHYMGPDGSSVALAERMGIDPAPLHKLLQGKRARIEHRAADEILTAIGRTDVMALLEAA